MTRKLLIIFASGLAFAVVLLSLAWVIGGNELITRIEKDENWSIGFNGDDDKSPQVSRNFTLDIAKPLIIAAPVTLEYTKGDKTDMVIKGSERLMNLLEWEDGRLSLKKRNITMGKGLTVTITAPQLPNLEIKGASDAELNGLDQPTLSIDASGALDLSGTGKVGTLSIDAKGASDINLSDVEAKDATVSIAGAGDVDISATGKVDASIAGAGSITLHRKPEQLTSRIRGAGSIEHNY